LIARTVSVGWSLSKLHDQNTAMTAAPFAISATSFNPSISAVASGIKAAQVRLLGSRAKGTARPDSDLDLLIGVPDLWLTSHDRMRVLGGLWRQYSSHRLPLDLLLCSVSEMTQRQQYRSVVTTRAYEKWILLHGSELASREP
jgi:hypothetical protein